MDVFFERLSELCQEKGTSPNAVAKKLGISSGSITAWKKGTLPRIETVQKLAEYFHVSADYLLGNVNDPWFFLDNERILKEINSVDGSSDCNQSERNAVLQGKFDDFTYAMHNAARELTEQDKQLLIDMATRLRKMNQK